ncbi:glycerate kinase [soil metagenome]
MRIVIMAEHDGGGPAGGPLDGSALSRGVARGWADAAQHDDVDLYLLSDGRAGFTDALTSIAERTTPAVIETSRGAETPAQMVSSGSTAYIEAADVVGAHLRAVQESGHAPTGDSSAAVGELLLAARATGAARVVLGVGNDVTCHDGGAGLLEALGAGTDMARLEHVRADWADMTMVLATASMSPLTGFGGASASLQTDRGLDAATAQSYEAQIGTFVDTVDAALRASLPSQVDLLTGAPVRRERTPGAGVGGGIGYAMQLLGAATVPGARLVIDEIGMARQLPGALVVLVTHRYDWRSISSGVVSESAAAASAVAAPTVLLADEVMVGRREGMSLGISSSYARRPQETPEQLGARVARTWSPPPRP